MALRFDSTSRMNMPQKKRTKSKSLSQRPKLGKPRKTKSIADISPLDRSSLLKLIHATIPLPTREENCADGSLIFIGGDPGDVVIRVARSQITVSVFGIVWEGPHTPLVRPQPLAGLNWRLMPAARLTTFLHDLIEAAQQIRLANFRKCAHCGETKPPEWMHRKDCCQSCAERNLGVVH